MWIEPAQQALHAAIEAGDLAEALRQFDATVGTSSARRQDAITAAAVAHQLPIFDALLARSGRYLDPTRQAFLSLGVHCGWGLQMDLIWTGGSIEVDEHRRQVFRYALQDDRHGADTLALARALTITEPKLESERPSHLLACAILALTYDAWAPLLVVMGTPDFPSPATPGVQSESLWSSLDDLVGDAPIAVQDTVLTLVPLAIVPRLALAQKARQRAQALATRPAAALPRPRARS